MVHVLRVNIPNPSTIMTNKHPVKRYITQLTLASRLIRRLNILKSANGKIKSSRHTMDIEQCASPNMKLERDHFKHICPRSGDPAGKLAKIVLIAESHRNFDGQLLIIANRRNCDDVAGDDAVGSRMWRTTTGCMTMCALNVPDCPSFDRTYTYQGRIYTTTHVNFNRFEKQYYICGMYGRDGHVPATGYQQWCTRTLTDTGPDPNYVAPVTHTAMRDYNDYYAGYYEDQDYYDGAYYDDDYYGEDYYDDSYYGEYYDDNEYNDDEYAGYNIVSARIGQKLQRISRLQRLIQKELQRLN